MAEMTTTAKGSARQLRGLLQAALSGPLAIAGEADGVLLLRRADGASGRHAASAVAAAVSHGLLSRRGGSLRATPQARDFLRRLLSGGDGEEAFRAQHAEIEARSVEVAGVRTRVRANATESPLAAVARLKDKEGGAFLPKAAIAAGERLAVDFERAGLQPRVTQSWEPRVATRAPGERGGSSDIAESALAARRRVAAAVDAMGPELSGVALDICCFCKGLELVERERQWPARSAKLMLKVALLSLARHYDPPPRPRDRHWMAE